MSSPIMERWYHGIYSVQINSFPSLSFYSSFQSPFPRCCNRRREGNHDEHGAVQSVSVQLLLGDRKRGGVFVRESGRRSVELTAEEDGGGPAPEVP